MTRGELVELTKFILDSNDRQTNGTFLPARVQYAVQMCYDLEWRKFRQVATRSQVVMSTEFTWTSGEVTQVMPLLLQDRIIHSTYDITDASGPLGVRTILYYDNMAKTLRWPGEGGPSRDTTYRTYFLPRCEKLEADDQTPLLIAYDHHEVIAWSAAVWLVTIANGDAAVPTTWAAKLDDLRTDYWKECSNAALADRARIMPDDAENLFYLGSV